MTEDDDEAIKARISRLEREIAQHNQRASHHPHNPERGFLHGAPLWSPYGRPRGRGRGRARGGFRTPVKSHQLVLNGANMSKTPTPPEPTATPENFVATHPNQLVNKDHLKRKEQLRAAKRQKLDRKERSSMIQHASEQGSRELVIEGIRFQLRDDGSKLIRLSDPTTSGKDTPKMAKVANVDFFRTKNGNLVRANAVKSLTRTNAPTAKPQCEHFTKHGKCPFGRNCRFAHDPEKVAICPAFLANKCNAGDHCDLSHVISINRVSPCVHFIRGNCNNDACRYPHVYISPAAPVCRPFARLGYCGNNDCAKRHVHECPDYANDGVCRNANCPLPHPDHAHVLRKAAATQAKIDSEEGSDISSDNEEDDQQTQEGGVEDIDSDDAEDAIMINADDGGRELSQQQDFVSFS